jgi:membrane associated rhomboid family serine protease
LRVAKSDAIATVRRMSRHSQAVFSLLVVNIAVFIAGALGPDWHEMIFARGAFWFPGNDHFGPAQAVTYMFLHGGMGHIFFNMFALLSFGSVLEREWGAPRFLIFYFLCGLGAGLIHTGVNLFEFNLLHERLVASGMTPATITTLLETGQGPMPTDPAAEAAMIELYHLFHRPMVGASGAIYGVMVGFALLHPNAKLGLLFVPVPIAAKIFIPVLLGLDLLSEITGFSLFGAGIAHFAHLGGAAIGFLLTLLWRKHRLDDHL